MRDRQMGKPGGSRPGFSFISGSQDRWSLQLCGPDAGSPSMKKGWAVVGFHEPHSQLDTVISTSTPQGEDNKVLQMKQ